MKLRWQNIARGWHFMRVLRLGIGIYMLAAAAYARDWSLAAFGGIFLYLAFSNAACCSAPPARKFSRRPADEITVDYEEIK